MTLPPDTLLEMYATMLLARRMDERAWELRREGTISYHISGIGHEAIQVGAAFAIHRGEDWVAPYYRDLALMLALGYPPEGFFMDLMGKRDAPSSAGRQMPGGWSYRPANVISTSAVAGSQVVHAVGVALGMRYRRANTVVLATCGEGATSQGEWYEAVNWAAVQQLPVIFLVENNQYTLSQGVKTQMAVESVAQKARGLGLPGIQVDGAEIGEVYEAVREGAERARSEVGPVLIEALTYRVTPHSSDDDDRTYRTKEEVNAGGANDPLKQTRTFLLAAGILDEARAQELDTVAAEIVNEAVETAKIAPLPTPQNAASIVFAQGDSDG